MTMTAERPTLTTAEITELARRVLVDRLKRAYDDTSFDGGGKGLHKLAFFGESTDPEALAAWEALCVKRELPPLPATVPVHPGVVAVARRFKEARK